MPSLVVRLGTGADGRCAACAAVPSLPYGRGLRTRGFAGRYVETDGSPSSQNRQGYAVASPPTPLTPTRGPVLT